MKVYEVKVEQVTYDMGYFNGYKHIAYTINEAKAHEIAEAAKIEIVKNKEWWITTGRDYETNEPNVKVVEMGEVVE